MRIFLVLAVTVLLALGAYAYIEHRDGCRRLAAEIRTAVHSIWSHSVQAEPPVSIAALTEGKLISADGNSFSFSASGPASSVQYYALYYSAQWCPPCHVFTPLLVGWYNKFKPAHPNFELIFVSEDTNETSMLSYMKEMAMPWPAVRFGALKHDGSFKGSGIEKFAGPGIPDLVLVDANGTVLADTVTWTGAFEDPRQVIVDIEKIVGPTASARPAPNTSGVTAGLVSGPTAASTSKMD
jgi:nucleoredoxin